MTKVKTVGLTGGIGSGKSTVAATFAELGGLIVDADAIQRLVVAPGSEGLAQIEEAFGSEMVGEDGTLNRAAMAKLVFADEAARKQLEAITHPLIQEETRRQMSEAGPDQVVVHDIPLLVELGYADHYELVVIVDAPVEVRVERVMRDRGMSREDAEARIAAQATEEARRAVADVWLENHGSRDELADEARRVWREQIVGSK